MKATYSICHQGQKFGLSRKNLNFGGKWSGLIGRLSV
jgi:hypothetical protein